MLYRIGLGLGILLAPAFAFAQSFSGTNLTSYINTVIDFINSTIVPLIIAVAVLLFIWGIFSYFILGASDEDKRKDGKTYMIYALIGFVLIVSVLGIIELLSEATGLQDGTINPPDVPAVGT